MRDQYNVLFLCTGNSARSIMAEAISNQLEYAHLRAYSAGSQPKGAVNPMALQVLSENEVPTEGLRSKSWNEFAEPGAPEMDLIITVCDRAAGEACPVWPGHPITAHWNILDPASETSTDIRVRRAFRDAFHCLHGRIVLLAALKLESLDRLALKTKLGQIGAPPLDQSA